MSLAKLKICQVVQLLMTVAFSDAKYFLSIEKSLILLELTNRFLFISYGDCFREDVNIFARLLNVQVNLSALILPSILSVI